MALIRLTDVTAGYGAEPVLRGLSLDVREGEHIALVGTSGAGKSTLLRLLYEKAGAAAALAPQDFGLVPSLSVFHNVYMGRLDRQNWLRNLRTLVRPARRDIEDVARTLRPLGLDDLLFRRAGELSGGQMQRATVGRALYRAADVLLADEPVSAVDEHQSRDVLAALLSGYRTTVLALHDRTLALEFSDRVIGLRHGRIWLDAPSQSLTPADLDPVYER